jgi:hypothetical protein
MLLAEGNALNRKADTSFAGARIAGRGSRYSVKLNAQLR